MTIAEALAQIAEFESIEDSADHEAAWTAFNAKISLLEHLQKHDPYVYFAYQQTLKPKALTASA